MGFHLTTARQTFAWLKHEHISTDSGSLCVRGKEMNMIKMGIALLGVALLPIFITVPLKAQSGQNCKKYVSCGWYSFTSGCVPALPPGITNCFMQGPWTEACQVNTNQCPPDAAADETCPTCAKIRAAKPDAGAPISLASGNTYIQQTDVRIPGLGGGLARR